MCNESIWEKKDESFGEISTRFSSKQLFIF